MPRANFLGQVQSGYYLVNLYSWGNVVAGGIDKGIVLECVDSVVRDRLGRVFPLGNERRSRELCRKITEARKRQE